MSLLEGSKRSGGGTSQSQFRDDGGPVEFSGGLFGNGRHLERSGLLIGVENVEVGVLVFPLEPVGQSERFWRRKSRLSGGTVGGRRVGRGVPGEESGRENREWWDLSGRENYRE